MTKIPNYQNIKVQIHQGTKATKATKLPRLPSYQVTTYYQATKEEEEEEEEEETVTPTVIQSFRLRLCWLAGLLAPSWLAGPFILASFCIILGSF